MDEDEEKGDQSALISEVDLSIEYVTSADTAATAISTPSLCRYKCGWRTRY